MNIYVSNLSFNVQDEDLREFFTPFGEVTSAKIINDRETGRSRGFGFVEMSDDQEARNAIDRLNGATLGNRTIVVNEARERREQGFGGGGSYNRDRRPRNGGGGYRDRRY